MKYLFGKISILICAIFILNFSSNEDVVQNKDYIVITYQNQLLRDLSKTYLKNPNYWEFILKYNGVNSASDFKQGDKIKIPVGIFKRTLNNISKLKSTISEANKNGAQVLTPELISMAENKYDKIIILKNKNKWIEASKNSVEALKIANKSLKKTIRMRKSAADASITYVKGDVQKRRPSEKSWSEAERFSKLFEADRARTLSNSITDITFIDLSRVRLNENSQAVIQHSRIDLYKNKTETKVKLIKGDAFAYLLSSPKKKFDIYIPGVDAKIKSKSFWLEKDDVSTKIANFDGVINLSAKDSFVVVKKNQGSLIPNGGLPSKPRDLLVPPNSLAPLAKSKIYSSCVEFSWEPVKEAKKYWLVVARDALFKKIILSEKNILEPIYKYDDLSEGVYYWHVCSIDKDNFPGSFSNYSYFIIVEDSIRPFLIVNSPPNNISTKEKIINVDGECESNLIIEINGNKIKDVSNGKFSSQFNLTEGKNEIRIVAKDQGGNSSEVIRNVFYESSPNIKNIIISDNYFPKEKLFITNNSKFTIWGKTRKNSSIILSYGKNIRKTTANSEGIYSILLNVNNDIKDLGINITTPAGYKKNEKFKVLFNASSPIIKLDASFDKLTNKESFNLSGEFLKGDSLFINSEYVKVVNNKFSQNIKLNEGENLIELVGKDLSTNKTKIVIKVVRDSKPPRLIKYSLRKNGKDFIVKIKADDSSGLKKSALFEYSLNSKVYKIILMLNKKGKTYYGKIEIPNRKEFKALSVSLEDYLQNNFTYKLD